RTWKREGWGGERGCVASGKLCRTRGIVFLTQRHGKPPTTVEGWGCRSKALPWEPPTKGRPRVRPTPGAPPLHAAPARDELGRSTHSNATSSPYTLGTRSASEDE